VSEAGDGSDQWNGRETTDQRESESAMDDTRKSRVRLGKVQRPVDQVLLGFGVRVWREVVIPLPPRLVPWNDENVNAKAAGRQINAYEEKIAESVPRLQWIVSTR